MRMLNIESRTFTDTAKAVYIMNDTIQEKYADWKELEDFMYSMAYGMDEPNYTFFSTAGFCLTAYDTPTGRNVTATIMPYCALEYLAKDQ
ncbi:unnamed protein product, partial [marine sediment metagenome]